MCQILLFNIPHWITCTLKNVKRTNVDQQRREGERVSSFDKNKFENESIKSVTKKTVFNHTHMSVKSAIQMSNSGLTIIFAILNLKIFRHIKFGYVSWKSVTYCLWENEVIWMTDKVYSTQRKHSDYLSGVK